MFKRFRAFSKGDNGEDLFYPWRYPGEALILTRDIRMKAILIYCGLFYGSFLGFILVSEMGSFGVISSAEVQFCFAVIVSLYHILYFVFVAALRKKCKLYVVVDGARPWKPLSLTWFFVLLQLLALYILISEGWLISPIAILFFLLLSVCAIFTIGVFILTIKTRGYLIERGCLGALERPILGARNLTERQ